MRMCGLTCRTVCCRPSAGGVQVDEGVADPADCLVAAVDGLDGPDLLTVQDHVTRRGGGRPSPGGGGAAVATSDGHKALLVRS